MMSVEGSEATSQRTKTTANANAFNEGVTIQRTMLDEMAVGSAMQSRRSKANAWSGVTRHLPKNTEDLELPGRV